MENLDYQTTYYESMINKERIACNYVEYVGLLRWGMI
jgi:hypothetical protein